MARNGSESLPTREAIDERCQALGFRLGGAALERLASYLTLLIKWNKVMNLVGPATWEDVLETLIIDSLYLADFIRALPLPENPQCRDLGAGAGLPGIPLRMLWEAGAYTLVEAREKRALFMRTCLAATPLAGVSVFQGRAEEYMRTAPPADLTVSRAFMPWQRMLDFVAPSTRQGAVCVFLTLSAIPADPGAAMTPEPSSGNTPCSAPPEPSPCPVADPTTVSSECSTTQLHGWEAFRQSRYLVRGTPRYFWAFRKIGPGAAPC